MLPRLFLKSFALAALVFRGEVHIGHVLALSFTTGFAQAFGGPAYQAMVPSLVHKKDLPNAIALNSIQFNLARVIGPIVAGVTLAAFGIVCLTVIWLRRTHPEIPRGYRVPLYPIVPAAGILSCLWLITSVPNYVLLIFFFYTLAMIVLYFLYGMRNSELAKGHEVMADDETAFYPEDAPDGGVRP